MYCLYDILYLVFLLPTFYSPVDPATTVDCRVRLRRRRQYHYRRASRQAEPLHLSLISPTCLYLSVALGICCCYDTFLFECIACLCRPLLYSLLSYATCYI